MDRHFYTTADEIGFVTGLASGKSSTGFVRCSNGWRGEGPRPDAFRLYAVIVLSDMRRYGPSVNIERVKATVRHLLQGVAA